MASSSNIEKAFLELNDIFRQGNLDNRILVLDFSHFTKVDNDRYNINTTFFGYVDHVRIYFDALAEAAKKEDLWKRFEEDNVRCIADYNYKFESEHKHYSLLDNPESDHFLYKRSDNSFKPEDVVSDLNTKLGKSILFVSKSFNNDEAQSVLYVTLENHILEKYNIPPNKADLSHFVLDYRQNKDQIPENARALLDKFFLILDDLLISEMIHSLYETGLQKERQSTFEDIWHNTNHMLGSIIRKRASDLENQILKNNPDYFNDTKKVTSELDDVMSLMELLRNINNVGAKGGYFYDREGNIRNYIEKDIKSVNLKDFIDQIIQSFITSIKEYHADTIRPTRSVFMKLAKNPDDVFDTEGIAKFYAMTIEISSFYNLLIDILRNATRYAFDMILDNDPKVTIWTDNYNSESSSIHLHIRNERGINLASWENWMSKLNQKTSDTHLGIRISKYMLNFYEIPFEIPKHCIVENGGSYTEIILHLKNDYSIPFKID